MREWISDWVEMFHTLHDWIWGMPLLAVILFVGLYLTWVTKGVQFRYFWYAHRLAFTRQDERQEGEITHFQALMTALSGTIGIGSITGVATAIFIGGIGSLFWMWVAALLGMATKFGEAILAIRYRIVEENGEMCGGPMYYIERGLGWKWMGKLFAILGVLTAIGTGNLIQANSVVLAVERGFGLNPIWTGLFLTCLVGISLIRGIRGIGAINAFLIPAMAFFYLAGGVAVIACKFHAIPSALSLIFRSAFHSGAPIGGIAGASVMSAIQIGVSRSIFSSEAGLGSSPVVAAAAKTDTPARQALVSMSTVFLTVGVVCTVTALAIAVSGVFTLEGEARVNGSTMILWAFDAVIPYGRYIVTIALIPFAYSTVLGWAYCGEKYLEYLLGYRFTKHFRIVYTILIFPAALINLYFVWDFSSIMNGLMTLPNLVALLVLGREIASETRSFSSQLKREKGPSITHFKGEDAP